MKEKITLKTILKNLDAIITSVTLLSCVVLVNANVIMRYFFNSPIRWSEEVVTSLFVWTVFIGSAYAYRNHSHLGVDVLVKLFPDKVRKVVDFVIAVLEMLVLIMLTIISAQYVYHLLFSRSGAFKPVLTDMLRVPKVYTAIAVPLGFGVSAIHSVRFMVQRIMAMMGKKVEGGEKRDANVY
jgi:TRAP-type C4-dicarboxylate transport system permease small subunit